MVDIRKRKLTDEELKVLVDAEIDGALGFIGGELTDQRTDAMDRYLGEPLGTEMEGRSQVHARDVMETIEWILPTLIRIFTAHDRAVEFIPVGPEDEEQAEQEADYLNYLFYDKQDGFLVLYSWFKDALLQKNGVVKTYPEEFTKVTKETYKNVPDIEWQALLSDEEYEIDEESHEMTEGFIPTPQGPMPTMLHTATLTHTEDDVRFCTEVIPPEEFLISKDARSVDPTKARFCAHITTKTVSELREMGYTDADLMQMEIGESEVELSEERISRMHLTDEERWDESATLNIGMRKVRVKECYVYADKDGDGIAELLKVFRSGDFIDCEEIDYHPFNAITPVILTHKYYGLSIADIVQEIQEIRTMLFRGYMDNINQVINGTTYYDEKTVNIEDMLSSKPFGIRGVDGNPHNAILHIPPTGLPPEAFTLNELLDKFLHSRIGDFQSQLDPNVLAQANTGVVLQMLNEAKAKVEMIARIFAEIGVKNLFRTYHHLVRKYSNSEDKFKLKNSWVPVNPQEWRERHNLKVKVGLGTQNNQEQIANLNGIFQNQFQLLQLGIPVVTPQNIFALMSDMAEKMGYVADKYWTHPQKIPPPPEKQDPNMAMIQAQMQIENTKAQLKMQEIQINAQAKAKEAEIKEAQIVAQGAINEDKNQLELIKSEMKRIETMTKAEKELLAMELKKRELDMKEDAEAASKVIEMTKHETKQMLDQYKAELQAAVELHKAEIATEKEGERRAETMIADLLDSIDQLRQEQSSDEDVVYDDAGRIIQIGKKKVVRNDDGSVARILKG